MLDGLAEGVVQKSGVKKNKAENGSKFSDRIAYDWYTRDIKWTRLTGYI